MHRLPTTDIYFMNSTGNRLGSLLRRGPIKRLGANSFASATVNLLFRRDEVSLMERMLSDPKKFVYLVDDDIVAAAENPGLPEGYRHRLAEFEGQFHRRLVEKAETLVVPSRELAERFGCHRDVRILTPYWNYPFSDGTHLGCEERLDIVHMGSASHGGGLAFLEPAIARAIDQDERVHFTYFGRNGALKQLDLHPRVHRLVPLPWRRYKRWIRRQRFHLALYPVMHSQFDRARSQNKIIEHMLVGAVGIYSDGWSGARGFSDCAILAGPRQEDWTAALSQALSRSEDLATIFERACTKVGAFNNPVPQRALWSDVLELDSE